MTGTVVVVLAAGRGVRMRSALPKVLHPAAGRPLLARVLANAAPLLGKDGASLVVVAGPGREGVETCVRGQASDATLLLQEPARGTGDAVRVASSAFGEASRVVVLSGDVPLLTGKSVGKLLAAFEVPGTAVAFLTAVLPAPGSYGRVVRDARGEVVRLVEAGDATETEREIAEVNAGIYAFDRTFLDAALPRLAPDNAQGELYLTDVVGMAVASSRRAAGIPVEDPDEILGVNCRADLARIEGILRRRAAVAAMEAGATLLRPETVTLDETVLLGTDTVVEPFVTLLGVTRVGEGTRIGQGCVIRDSALGRDVTVKPYCVIEEARVSDRAIVGPFSRLREGTELAEDVHVGNFVETKKARLARGVKANHLTYLGDVWVGERTNVGAGVITCNYDGFAKHRTTIGSDVFVGSDTQLVAPVTVGNGAVVAAGTTVTEDVPADALALSRSAQKNTEQGGARYREKKRAKTAGTA